MRFGKMSTTLLQTLFLLTLSVVEPRTSSQKQNCAYTSLFYELDQEAVRKRSSETECTSEHLECILQSCEESVRPSSISLTSRFCGSECKDRVAAYAQACNHINFSINVTGTCLVNNNHPQCIFAVILIRPGILSCTASALTNNSEVSTVTTDPSISPQCSLNTTYNTTGEFYQIEFDPTLMQPVIAPPLEPPWENCTDYYNENGHPIQVKRTTTDPDEIECSQSQLEEIVRDCEQAVRPQNDSTISREFCGGTCRNQVNAYAAVCNLTNFSLNITGSCQIDSSEVQCIFAVILIRPGISFCSPPRVNNTDIVSTIQANTPPCCVLNSSVNTTGEFFTISPDPQTGTPIINPPLVPPWDSCSAYTASTDYTCVDESTTSITSTTTQNLMCSAPSLHATKHLYLVALIFVFNLL